MIAYQLRLPAEGDRTLDFVAGDDAAARSFALSHCMTADCEVWAGDPLVHRHVGEPAPEPPASALAPGVVAG